MRKPDFFNLPMRELPRKQLTITEPDWSGEQQTLDIELEALDEPKRHLVVDMAGDLMAMYVGDPTSGVAPKKLPISVRGPRGRVKVTWSFQLALAVARVFVQQTGTSLEEKCTVEQLAVSTLTWTRGWNRLNRESSDLQNEANKALEVEDESGDKSGNASGEDTEDLSEQLSPESSPIP